MEIVRMEERHLDVLCELERLCFSVPWNREALKAELSNPAAHFFVAEEESVVLGYAGMHAACGECYLDNVAVFPQMRRRGVGTALLLALEREALDLGGEFLSLEVRTSDYKAITLYRMCGFAEAGRRKNFYSHPPEDGLIMTKHL